MDFAIRKEFEELVKEEFETNCLTTKKWTIIDDLVFEELLKTYEHKPVQVDLESLPFGHDIG